VGSDFFTLIFFKNILKLLQSLLLKSLQEHIKINYRDSLLSAMVSYHAKHCTGTKKVSGSYPREGAAAIEKTGARWGHC